MYSVPVRGKVRVAFESRTPSLEVKNIYIWGLYLLLNCLGGQLCKR